MKKNYLISKSHPSALRHWGAGLMLGAALVLPQQFAHAAEQQATEIPAAFAGESPQSDFSVLYNDLDTVLRQIVLVTGRSDRSKPAQARPSAGSHIVRGTKSQFSLEGNRVHFPALAKEENVALLSQIRRELEAVPNQLPLHLLRKEEQLAYWLNLYNVTVLEQVALRYPKSSLRKLFKGKKSLWNKKLLTVAGHALSLNDIQHQIILPKFKNPLVMYGMFQGFVGGPNIRNEAYTGDKVFQQLKENAEEFVNSNRGMHTKERLMRVSHLYRVNETLFPNWERDLRRHLTHLASSSYYRDKLRKASRLSPKVTGFEIADIYGGSRSRGSAANTNSAAFLGAIEAASYGSQASGFTNDGAGGGFTASGAGGGFVSSDGGAIASKVVAHLQMGNRDGGRFPVHVVEYLMRVHERNNKREGEVTIEELENKEKPESKEEKTTPESQDQSAEPSG